MYLPNKPMRSWILYRVQWLHLFFHENFCPLTVPKTSQSFTHNIHIDFITPLKQKWLSHPLQALHKIIWLNLMLVTFTSKMGTCSIREKVLHKIMSNMAQPVQVVWDYSCIQYRYLLWFFVGAVSNCAPYQRLETSMRQQHTPNKTPLWLQLTLMRNFDPYFIPLCIYIYI
jgi:hypothetical protein